MSASEQMMVEGVWNVEVHTCSRDSSRVAMLITGADKMKDLRGGDAGLPIEFRRLAERLNKLKQTDVDKR
jgi:hypothetical protein